MSKVFKGYLFLGSIAGVIVIIDQITKALVRDTIPLGGMWSPWPWLTPFARFVHINNTGVAFGMFNNQDLNPIFAVLAVIVSVAIIYYFPRVPEDERILRLALALMLAGAVGNLIDRVVQGEVTDFISVGRFAIFNVADSSITVGVGVLLLGIWLQERRSKKINKSIEGQETHDPPGAGD